MEREDGEWNIPLSQLRQMIMDEKQQAERHRVLEPRWTNDSTNIKMSGTTGSIDRLKIVKNKLSNMTSVGIIEILLDKAGWNLVQHTNLNSTQNNNLGFFVSEAEGCENFCWIPIIDRISSATPRTFVLLS